MKSSKISISQTYDEIEQKIQNFNINFWNSRLYERKVKTIKRIALIFIICSILLISFFIFKSDITQFGNRLTGFSTQETQLGELGDMFSDSLSLEINNSQEYEWHLENYGQLTSAKISGKLFLTGKGNVKIYFQDKLIFDSSNLESSKNIISKRSIITGLAVEGGESDSGGESSGNSEGESSETTQETPVEPLGPVEPTTPEIVPEIPVEPQPTPEENITEPIEPLPEENVTEENITIPEENITIQENISEENVTNITEENTTEENITENITIEEIDFSDICLETCDLASLNLTDESYLLRFELENASLELDSITYTLLPIENISEENITNITIENATNVTNHAPELVQEIPDQEISMNANKTINLLEYFIDEDNDTLAFNSTQPENITVLFDNSLAILVPDENFTGNRSLKFYASDGNLTTESNEFLVNVVENLSNLTLELTGNTVFSLNEQPEFELKYKDEKTSEQLKKSFKGEPLKARKELITSQETLEVSLYNKDGEVNIGSEIQKTSDFKIILDEGRELKPGKYILKVDYIKDNQSQEFEQEFYWGILAINTHKSIYTPGETANIDLGILDLSGRVVCDAQVVLEITDPENKTTILRTPDDIKVSDECKFKGFTYIPDYSTNYQTNVPGEYQMILTAKTYDGTYSINDSFLVQPSVLFDVEREEVTRINPVYGYKTKIIIKANQDYQGTIVEKVPSSFDVKSDGQIIEQGYAKEISWNVNLKKDDSITLEYEFDAPDISPLIFLTGPLEIGSWHEFRKWQIASDQALSTIIRPMNAGTYTQFLYVRPGGSAHWSVVDESTNNVSDWIASTTLNNKDTFAMEDISLPVGATIINVTISAMACRSNASNSYRNFSLMFRSNSVDNASRVFTAATGVTKWNYSLTVDPGTGSAWTQAGVNAMEAGANVTGATNRGVNITQLWAVVNYEPNAPVASFGINPIDTYNDSDGSIIFDVKCSDNDGTSYLQLWTNTTGTWQVNQTNSSPINNSWWNVSVSGIPNGNNFKWAVWCNDSGSNTNITTNRTLNVDTTPPTITLPVYINATMYRNTQSMIFNVSVTDAGVGASYCNINVNGSTNQTLAVSSGWCNGTYSLSGLSDGNQTIYAYANDTLGNTALNNSYVVWIDSTAPSVTNTKVNQTSANTSTVICINTTASDSGTGISQVWTYITWPNATQANLTMSDTGSCAGSGGDNIYGINIDVGSTAGNFAINTSYANDSLNNVGQQSPWPNINVSVTIAADTTNPIASFGINPVDTYNSTSSSITFDLKCSDNVNVSAIQLWTNTTGTWQVNQTNSSPINDSWWNVSVSGIPEGNWIWATWCNDTSSLEDWTDTNRTFKVGLAPTYSLNSTNDTSAGSWVMHNLKWQDNINLSGFIFSFSNCTGGVGGTWWNSSFSKKQAINVSVASGSTTTNYPVYLNITYDSDMQTDFDDLRFTNGSQNSKLDYWLENKVDSSWATVWVEVDQNITTSNYTFYMYYGNSSVSSESNGTNTFDFFDDFNDGNYNGWTVDYGTWSVSSGILQQTDVACSTTCWGDGIRISSISSSLSNRIVQVRERIDDISGSKYVGFSPKWLNYGNSLKSEARKETTNVLRSQAVIGSSAKTAYDAKYTLAYSTWYSVKMKINSTGGFKSYINGTLENDSVSSDWSQTWEGISLHTFSTLGSFDDVLVAKYVTPEPVSYTGSEEQYTGQATSYVNDSWVSMTGTENWSNVSKLTTSTIGCTIKWRVYANDSLNNWNVSQEYSYLTTSPPWFDASPTIVLNSPINYYNSTNPITFNCTGADDKNVTNVSLYGNWLGTWQANETNSSPVNNTPTLFSKTIPDGTYNWSCQACDNSSQCVFETNRTFTVDATAPVALQGTSPVDNANLSSSVTFDLKCSDNVQVSSLQLWGNWTGTWQMNKTNSSPINDSWWNVSVSGIPEGNGHIWAAWCNDTSSLEDWTDTNRTFNVDKTAPTITLLFYTNATKKKNTDSLTLNVSVSDSGTGASYCLINANGTNQTYQVSSGWCNVTDIALTNLADGNQTIYAYANDTAGNWGLNNSYVVFIDTTAPYDNNPSDASYEQNSAANISWTLYDNYTPGYYYVLRNGTIQNATTSWANNTALDVWVNTTTLGLWNYTIVYNDSLGNSNSDEVIINVTSAGDVINPTADFGTNPIDNYNDSDGNITFDLKCSDNVAPSYLQLWGNWNIEWFTPTSVYDKSGESPENPASNTIDNDTGTYWQSDPAGQYIAYDLSASKTIYKLKIYTNSSQDKSVCGISGIYVSDDPGSSWGDSLGSCNDFSSGLDWHECNLNSLLGGIPSGEYIKINLKVLKDKACIDTILDPSELNGFYEFQAEINSDNSWRANQTNSSPINNTVWTITVDGIAEGTWNWAAWCNDSSSLEDWTDTNRTFTVDKTSPSVSSTQVNDTSVNTDEFICINAIATDSSGIDKVWALITWPNATELNVTMSDTGTSCSGSGGDNIYGVEINVGSDVGTFTINTTYANDSSGNIGNQTPWPVLNVTVSTPDITSPIASFGTNPVDNYNDSDGSINFELSCSDNIDVDYLQLWGNWSGTWKVNQTNSSPINNTIWSVSVDGIPAGNNHQWAVWCNDSSGLTNITTNRTFNVDKTAPTVTLPFYTNATKKKNTDTLTLNVSVTDSGTSPSACVINVVTSSTGNQTIDYSDGWCNGTYSLAGASDGNQTIYAYANDTAGNIALNNSYVVWIDTTGPTYSDNSTNGTTAGTWVEHRLRWQDTSGLSGFIFSFSNCTIDSEGSATWWNHSFSEKKAINVSVPSGYAGIDYQVKLNITYDFDMQSDFDDLRFTNGSQNSKLDYWLENKVDSSWATVWVEVDQNITTSNYTFYMYYGNANVPSESNGTNTFDFFDSFDSFYKYSGNPIIVPESGWETTNPGQVPADISSVGESTTIVEDGVFHMWYRGGPVSPGGNYSIGYANSTDGITWIKYTNATGTRVPVISGYGNGIGFPHVIKVNGIYYLYGTQMQNLDVYRWASNDGINWQIDNGGNPVLENGSVGSWDGIAIANTAEVYVDGDEHPWKMLYEARGSDFQIGYAYSDDGLSWTKYAGNPVLGKNESIPCRSAYAGNPELIKIGSNYYTFYGGMSAGSGILSICVAKSSDLITWTELNNNPEVFPTAAWEYPTIYNGVGDADVVYDVSGKQYNTYIYYNGGQEDIGVVYMNVTDFETYLNRANNWTPTNTSYGTSKGIWIKEDGVLKIASTANPAVDNLTLHAPPYTIRAKVKQTTNTNWTGLIYRTDGTLVTSKWAINQSTSKLIHSLAGASDSLINQATNLNQFYTLEIKDNSTGVKAYFNDVLKDTLASSDNNGNTMIGVASYGTKAEFDDFLVRKFSEVEPDSYFGPEIGGEASYEDDPWVPMTELENWSNVTKFINTTTGCTIRWRVYANDSVGNWNASLVYAYSTGSPPDAIDPIASFGTNPIDNYHDSDGSITFQLSCSDNVEPDYLQLWGNWSGTWQVNQTNSSPINNTVWSVAVTGIPQGTNHKWAVYCNDTNGNDDWTDTNRTLNVETGSTVTSCRELNLANTIYLLQNNVSSSGTCFNVTVDNVTLDCQGYKINYSSEVAGSGVYVENYNLTQVKNCEVDKTNYSCERSPAIYFINSNNGTIQYNIITTGSLNSDGVRLINSSNDNVTNNLISVSGLDINGIGSVDSNNIIVEYNNITSSDSTNIGISPQTGSVSSLVGNKIDMINGGLAIDFYKFTDTNITSNYIIISGSNNSWGIRFRNSSNNILMDNVINSSATSIYGLYLNNSDNTTVINNNIQINNSNENAIYLGNSNNNAIQDSILNASYNGTADIYIVSSGINNLTNVTFNKSDTTFEASSTGKINVKWYMDVYVNDSNSLPVESANVTSTNINNNLVNWSLTNSSGYISRLTLREYMQNFTNKYFDTNYTVNASKAGVGDDTEQVNLTNNKITDDSSNVILTLVTAAQAPVIEDISAILDQNITEGGITNVVFYVNVSDAQGYATIDTVNATFTRTGEETRQNSTCVLVSNLSSTLANYSCTIGIWYWDSAGIWQVNATANDTTGLISQAYNESFSLGETIALAVSPSQINWQTLIPGLTNKTATNHPSLLNNTGNVDTSVQVKALDLYGQNNSAYFIGSGNFSVDTDTGGNPPAECDGTIMENNSDITIIGASLPAGNNSKNFGNETSGQEQLYYCLKSVPNGLIAQTYSTSALGSWIIKIVVLAALIVPARRRKKKLKNETSREALLSILKITLTELKDKYSIPADEIIKLVSKEQLLIPLSIFKKEKTIGALESLCKYLKENTGLSFSEIAKLIGRDERTVWNAYHDAYKKKSEKFVIEEKESYVPLESFNKRLTILESIILFLKEKNNNVNVAKILGRDPRNVYSIYKRAQEKLKE
jgi:hypothetical protein